SSRPGGLPPTPARWRSRCNASAATWWRWARAKSCCGTVRVEGSARPRRTRVGGSTPTEGAMAKTEWPRLAVVGAGPIGLEVALYARRLGMPVTVYERGRLADHVQRWGHVRLFSPFGMNSTPLGRATLRAEKPSAKLPGDTDLVTGREHVAAYLEPLA